MQEKVRHILDCQLKDTLKAQILQPDGTYDKIDKRGKVLFGSQAFFAQEAAKLVKEAKKQVTDKRVFIPETKPEGAEEE